MVKQSLSEIKDSDVQKLYSNLLKLEKISQGYTNLPSDPS